MMKPVAASTAWLASAFLSAAAAAAPGYSADPQQSRVEFVGVQAGAEFKGTFHKFTAAIEFAPGDLASSRFDVQIDLNSVDTLDKDRDTTIRGPDIFDVAHYPTAHYVARSFTKTAAGYAAVGALTLRGVTKEVAIDFHFTELPAGAKLEGNAKLKRLDFGAGQGDWKSTDQVADAVKINFSLALKPKT
ncbi:MAG TPA: YceI family protein [Steroidobacteraceae bacterium]|jgi:polyisoprenoid-binding protein YceI|nr:YceI family protein [Steroidobacteraceae bacterium]